MSGQGLGGIEPHVAHIAGVAHVVDEEWVSKHTNLSVPNMATPIYIEIWVQTFKDEGLPDPSTNGAGVLLNYLDHLGEVYVSELAEGILSRRQTTEFIQSGK